MKKNLIRKIMCLIPCAAILTGCTAGYVLTEEQNEMIAQYVAGEVYKHTYAFQNKYPDYGLTYEEEITEAETAVIDPEEVNVETLPQETKENASEVASETAEPETEKDTSPVKSGTTYDLEEALDLNGLTLTYESYEIVDEYPNDENAWFTFSPQEGYRFLIVNFKLSNPGTERITVNTTDQHPVFRVTFEDETYTSNYTNLMDNDLSNLSDVAVEVGESYDCILVFMILDAYAEDMGTVTISIGETYFEIR